jgi:hypothetical protein
MPDLRLNLDLNGPQLQPGPQGPENPPVVPNPPPIDPAVQNAVNNPIPPNLQPGNGQGPQFAANHDVGAGRDWDMVSADGMLETARKAVEHIKAGIAAKEKFAEFANAIVRAAGEAMATRPPGDAVCAELADALTEFKAVLGELQAARASLTDAVKDGSGTDDPRAALAEIRKTLRVFRYEMQVELAKRGHATGNMDLYEGALRNIQHTFTFNVGSKVSQTFARVMQLESRLDDALAAVRNRLRELNPGTPPPVAPAEIKIAGAAAPILELSHLTNDQIRNFQDADVSTAMLRDLVGEIAIKGGERHVEFTVGAGALIGLGFSEAFSAGVRAGARFRVAADIVAPGMGQPINVTFRIAGGLEGKVGITAGKESEWAGAQAGAALKGEISHFTTRSYARLDDFLLDTRRNQLAISPTLGGMFVAGLKCLGRSIGGLGTKFFRWLGRKSGEVKQNNAQYLETLKARGVAGGLDKLLAKRANPVIVAERKGWTVRGQGQANASADFGGLVTAGASVASTLERDFGVDSHSFSTLARAAIAAKDEAALAALMLPDPDDGVTRPVDHLSGGNIAQSLENRFEEAIAEAKAAEKRSAGPFRFTDKAGYSRAANKIRSLMLATELAAREGKITRAQADRLLSRYSNPSVKFPPDIYRTYFMTGTGAAKPAKIRTSFLAKLKLALFGDWSKGLTSGIANPIGKAVAGGAVNAMRREIGLDTTFQYQFSAEMPAKPGADPRPWENVTRTTHSLLVSASAPARVVIDAITRTYVNGGKRLEDKPKTPVKDAAKDLAADIGKDTATVALTSILPGLILASVKESVVNAVKNWIKDPENIKKLVLFCMQHADVILDTIVGAVEWVAEHPDATLQIIASVKGASSLGESERYKKISWSFVDGQFETLTVAHESQSTIGVNVDPVGVGLGLGFDISYSVTENVKERTTMPRPSLTMLLAAGEQFIFGETGLHPVGGGEAFKTFLSRNAMGVQHMLAHLVDPENVKTTTDLYAGAQLAASRDSILLHRLQDAWHAVHALPADATLDRKIDAAHDLLVAMVLAYRTQSAEAA